MAPVAGQRPVASESMRASEQVAGLEQALLPRKPERFRRASPRTTHVAAGAGTARRRSPRPGREATATAPPCRGPRSAAPCPPRSGTAARTSRNRKATAEPESAREDRSRPQQQRLPAEQRSYRSANRPSAPAGRSLPCQRVAIGCPELTRTGRMQPLRPAARPYRMPAERRTRRAAAERPAVRARSSPGSNPPARSCGVAQVRRCLPAVAVAGRRHCSGRAQPNRRTREAFRQATGRKCGNRGALAAVEPL